MQQCTELKKAQREGCVKIDDIAKEVEDLKVEDRSTIWNTDLIESLELQTC